MTPALAAKLNSFFQPAFARPPDGKTDKRRWQMGELIRRWCTGDLILPDDELKPLRPGRNGVWEFRTHYGPGYRLMGALPEFNVFIGFELLTRKELGNGGSPQWQAACLSVSQQWQRYYGDRKPLRFHGEFLTIREAKAYWA